MNRRYRPRRLRAASAKVLARQDAHWLGRFARVLLGKAGLYSAGLPAAVSARKRLNAELVFAGT